MTKDDLYIYAQELGATPEQAEAILDANDSNICGCGDENGPCYDDNKRIIEREVAALDTDEVNTVLSKMEAYVFVAMLASFSLGALTWEVLK